MAGIPYDDPITLSGAIDRRARMLAGHKEDIAHQKVGGAQSVCLFFCENDFGRFCDFCTLLLSNSGWLACPKARNGHLWIGLGGNGVGVEGTLCSCEAYEIHVQENSVVVGTLIVGYKPHIHE